jgi:hypothetical protein
MPAQHRARGARTKFRICLICLLCRALFRLEYICRSGYLMRIQALRFTMLENGRRALAVIMVPSIIEFSIGGLAKAVANDSTGVAAANGRVRTSRSRPRPTSGAGLLGYRARLTTSES